MCIIVCCIAAADHHCNNNFEDYFRVLESQTNYILSYLIGATLQDDVTFNFKDKDLHEKK